MNESVHSDSGDPGVDAHAFNNFAFHENEVVKSFTDPSHLDNTESDVGVHTNSVIITELPAYDNSAFHVSSDDLTSRGHKVNGGKDTEKSSSISQQSCCSSRCIVATVVILICVTIALGIGLGVGLGLGLRGKTNVNLCGNILTLYNVFDSYNRLSTR